MEINNDDLVNRPGIFMPEDTVIEKELNKRLKKQFDEKHDITKLLEQSLIIATLLAHQNSQISRDFIQKILPKIKEMVEIQASKRADWKVLCIKIAGGLIQAVAAAGGAYGIANAVNSGANQAAISVVQNNKEVASAVGSIVAGGGDWLKDYNQGPSDIRQYAIEEKKRIRDLNQQSGQSADSKEGEQLRNLQQVLQAIHQIMTQILGLSSG